MRKKLFRSLVGFSLIVSLLLCILLTGGMYLFFNQQLREQLVKESDTIVSLLNTQADDVAFLEAGAYINRVTLIDSDGTVLYDSQSDAAQMENHGSRSEIVAATLDGDGWASRNSATLGETSVYYARKLSSGQVLRVAGAQKNVLSMLGGMFWWLLLGLVVSTLLASQLARPLTRAWLSRLTPSTWTRPCKATCTRSFRPCFGAWTRRTDASPSR
jgi:two-component system phosphate regulon sensor histidine kinase PhoR